MLSTDGIMEKEFEAYEYLVKYNGIMENDIHTGQRVVIVQENGHLFNENKPTDIVAQQNTKDFESAPCPVFEATQQPVYFQLNNSSELIPISVNSIPTGEPSNLFENTYLLPSLSVEVIEPDNDISNKHNEIPCAPNLKKESENMDIDTTKLPGGYAEITLNDEQYEILKQKGWILLEIADKVFLLDSLGLHEITNDHGLISKLKDEANQIIDTNSEPSGCSTNVVMIPEIEKTSPLIVPKQEISGQIERMEIISGTITVHQEEIADLVTQVPMANPIPSIPIKEQENDTVSDDNNETVQTKKKPSKVYLKTKYSLKDIPNEIVLGKTASGKNLIARIIKGKGVFKNTPKTNKDMKSEMRRDCHINDKQFARIVQQVLLSNVESSRTEDIASVETVMSQMFRVPDLRQDLHKHKLIVTKTIREENEDGLIENQSEPAVVTGRFVMNGNEGGFVHIPDMLQQHMKSSELEKSGHSDHESEKTEHAMLKDDMFLHINITETKDINNICQVSVMINKRYLSLTQVYNMKTKHINAVYACTCCAKIFKSQEELKDHQEHRCSQSSVSSADSAQPYTVVKTCNKVKSYMCNECKAIFVELKECQEHLRIHSKETDQEVSIDATNLESSERKHTDVFKCKMCDNVYFHSSSLTKHILAMHIKQKNVYNQQQLDYIFI